MNNIHFSKIPSTKTITQWLSSKNVKHSQKDLSKIGIQEIIMFNTKAKIAVTDFFKKSREVEFIWLENQIYLTYDLERKLSQYDSITAKTFSCQHYEWNPRYYEVLVVKTPSDLFDAHGKDVLFAVDIEDKEQLEIEDYYYEFKFGTLKFEWKFKKILTEQGILFQDCGPTTTFLQALESLI